MISENLLPKVLGYGLGEYDINFVNDSIVLNKLDGYGGYGKYTTVIDKYELLHKCKNWILKQNYVINIRMYGIDLIIVTLHANDYNLSFIRKFKKKTEHEAVFKACEWLNKN